MKPPATIVVGEVVRLRDKLNWYERLPLFGKRIVVTRAKGQANTLSARLAALGAAAIEIPTIEIRPAADYAPLDRAIAHLLLLRLADLHQRQRRPLLPGPPGPFHHRPARAAGKVVRHRPRHARRHRDAAPESGPDGQGVRRRKPARSLRALRPRREGGSAARAAVARDLVPVELARRGAHVDVVEAYRTVVPDEAARQLREVFDAAPSRLRHLHQFLHGREFRRRRGRGIARRRPGGFPSARSPRAPPALSASRSQPRRASSPWMALWKPSSGCTLG